MHSRPRRREAREFRSWWRQQTSATRCCGRSCRSSPVSRSAPLPPNSTAAASRAGAASLGTLSRSGMRWYASAFGRQGARHDASPRRQGPLRQAHRTRTAAAACHFPRQARRAAGQTGRCSDTTTPAVEWQTDVNPYRGPRRSAGGDADDRVDADDPAAAKSARWARNSARRHRRRTLGDCSDVYPDGLAILAGVWLRGLAPTPVEQDGDGLYACAGWRIGLTHDAARERTASSV